MSDLIVDSQGDSAAAALSASSDIDDVPTCAVAAVTVYFDGSCPLCQREIALAKKLTHPSTVGFRDVSGYPPREHIAPDLTAADAMARFHVRRADDALVSGAAAFLEMWTAAPRLRFLRPLLRGRLAIAALDAVYSGFLKVRPYLSGALRRHDARRKL